MVRVLFSNLLCDKASQRVANQSGVMDVKTLFESGRQGVEQRVFRATVRYDEMRGQRHAGGTERPDVQIVHISHTPLISQVGHHGRGVDAGGHAIQG